MSNIAAFRERHALPPQRAERTGKAKGGGAKGAGTDAGSGSGFPIGVSIMGHPAHADAAQKLEGAPNPNPDPDPNPNPNPNPHPNPNPDPNPNPNPSPNPGLHLRRLRPSCAGRRHPCAHRRVCSGGVQ